MDDESVSCQVCGELELKRFVCLNCQCKNKSEEIVLSIQKHIKKISKWLDEYREGTNPELKRKPPMMPNDMWENMEEERYEYLENFMMHLIFFLEYPDREMNI